MPYPNPFVHNTTIISKEVLKQADLNLYSASGSVVKRINNISGQRIVVERNGLTRGVYLYQLTQGGKLIASGKLIVID